MPKERRVATSKCFNRVSKMYSNVMPIVVMNQRELQTGVEYRQKVPAVVM